MMATYIPLLILFTISLVIALGMFTLTSLLGPKNPPPERSVPFECGSFEEGSVGGREVRPSVKFYMTAILFVVFDIEAVLIYPWTIQFRSLGWLGLLTMGSFLLLLAAALIYVWKKGALEWEA